MKWLSRQYRANRRPYSRLKCVALDDRIVPAGPRAILDLTPDSGPTVSINVDSFAFGLERPTDLSSPLSSKSRFDGLTVSALYLDNSPMLQAKLTSGGPYDTGKLTQLNETGQTVAVWMLDTVYLTRMAISGDNGRPMQDIEFHFFSMTEKTSSSIFSWDQSTALPTGPALPSGLTLSAFPTPTNPAITIDFTPPPGGSSLQPFSVAVDNYEFVSTNGIDVGDGPAFEKLQITSAFHGSSPRAHRALMTGSHYGSAVLTQRNAAGNPIAAWALGTVFIESDVISGGEFMPTSTMTLEIGSMTMATSTLTKSWSIIENNSTGPSLPAGLTFSQLPADTSSISLQIPAVSGVSPAITIPVTLFEFGFATEFDLGSSGGGAGTGKVDFDTVVIRSQMLPETPNLFLNTMLGSPIPTATLIYHNSKNEPLAAWLLGGVFLDRLTIADGYEGPAQELSLSYSSVTEATQFGYSVNTNTGKATGPSVPGGMKFVPLPSVPSTTTLELQPILNSGLKAVAINVDVFSFGFDSDSSSGAAGQPNFQAMKVEFDLANHSPYLVSSLISGRPFGSGTLIQRDSSGNALAVWQMESVYVTSDLVVGDGGLPRQTIELQMLTMTEATATSQISWNQATNSSTGPTLPAGLTFAALPTAPATTVSLELIPMTGQGLPYALTLPVNDFNFGVYSDLGKGKFNALEIMTPYSANSPKLHRAIFLPPRYGQAILTQRDSTGQVVLAWVMGDVFVQSDAFTFDEGAGFSTVKLEFLSVTEATSAHQRSWHQVDNIAVGPTLPAGLVISPLPPTPNLPTLVLELDPFSGPDIVLPINSFSFELTNSLTGGGGGKVSFGTVNLETELFPELPLLFESNMKYFPYESAMIVYRNGSGKAAAVWGVGNATPHMQTTIGADGSPKHQLSLLFTQIASLTESNDALWDNLTNSPSGPALKNFNLVSLIDPPAKVQSTIVNDGANQRSMVNRLVVNFSTAVELPSDPASAFTLSGPGGAIPFTVTLSGDSKTTATIAFNQLNDGRYTLQINPDLVQDIFYRTLDGDSNGTAGGNYSFAFHRLFGDADGNASVNAVDFNAFRLDYGKTGFSIFDFNDDNQTSASDFNAFRTRYGITLGP